MAATRPRLAVISVGAKNTFGHPSPEVVDRLTSARARVMRTDTAGTVDVALDRAGVD